MGNFYDFKCVRRIYEYFCPSINLYLRAFFPKVTIAGILLISFLGCCIVWMWVMLLKFRRHLLAPSSQLSTFTSYNNPRTELTLSVKHSERKKLLKSVLFEKQVLKDTYGLRRHEVAKEWRKFRKLNFII